MSFSGFARLPPELVTRVVSDLDTPRDLLALITTSQYLHRVFQGSQISILAAVIRNAMLDDNISVAVAACNAARISKLGWTGSPAADVAKAQDEFFEEITHRRVFEDRSLYDRGLLLSLYKLWWTLDYFLGHFQRDAFEIAARNMPLLQKQQHQDITRNERTRLQRAFLRFEIYRRLTPLHLQGEPISDEAYNQTLAFLKYFPPWEREEILSVQEFLVEFAKDIVRNCEDYMVREISDAARDMVAKLGALQQTFEVMSPRGLRMALDMSALNIFLHDDFAGERRFQFFVGRGLPFIKWLSNLPLNHRVNTIGRLSLQRCIPTLLDVLVEHSSEIDLYDAEVGWSVKQHMGHLRHPNQGWLWAEANNLTKGEKPLLKRYALRRMGYIFWDVGRLHDDWGLGETLPSMLELAPRSDCDDDSDWLEEEALQERFKDISIPEEAFRKREDRSDAYSRLIPSDEWSQQLNGTYPMPTPFSAQEAKLFSIEY